MVKLSALLIVKNEASVIEGCLNSLAGFEEVIVVDTGSTDRTIDIAIEFGNVRLFEFPWIDDFAAARNFCLQQAKGDWCMQIDADHRLMTPVQRIRDWCYMSQLGGHAVCSIHLTHAASGHSHLGAWLFRNLPYIEYVGRVHEVLNTAATNTTDIEQLYSRSPSHNLDPDRNLRILQKSEDNERTRFYLGMEYRDRGMWPEAIIAMTRYLEIGTRIPEICEANLVLARAYWATGQGDLARTHVLKCVKDNPMFKEALQFAAEVHYEPWRSKWLKLSTAADNSDVLFVRVVGPSV